MNTFEQTNLQNMMPAWYNPLDKFFRNDIMGLWNGNIPETLPALNIRNSNDGMRIELAIPGLSKEDMNVFVKGNSLFVTSERKTPSTDDAAEETFFRREFNYSAFSRSIPLPEHTDSDKITANYNNGILEMWVPKKSEAQQTRSRRIKID